MLGNQLDLKSVPQIARIRKMALWNPHLRKISRSPDVIQDEDTDYLHAFLTRAKAKRAAREASPQKVERISHSPMTRSRAALVPLSTNSASPKKTNKHE